MPFGFSTTTGFTSPTLAELEADLVAKYQAVSGILVDLAIASPEADRIRADALMFKAAYDDAAGVYGAGFVGSSSGAALRNLLLPVIGEPLAATKSTVVLPLAGVALTNVASGSAVTLDSDGPGAVQWLLQAPVIIPGNGTFAYSQTGPKTAAAASAWTIATPVAGWTTAGPNVAAAALGRNAETEAQYRARYLAALRLGRLVAEVAALEGVTSVGLFENETDVPDTYWGATHWVELLVEGGDDNEIGQTIKDNITWGVNTLGTTTVAVTGPGRTSVSFSRPNLVDLWVEMTIIQGEDYSADSSAAAKTARENAIKSRIVTWGQGRAVGLDVSSAQIVVQAMSTPTVPGILDITPAFVEDVNPPTTTIVVANTRDRLVFDATRISIIGA